MSAFGNGTVVNGCTVTAQPTGSGIYGGQFQLQRPDGSYFYDYLNAYSGQEPQNQTTVLQNGFNVNATNPFPVSIVSAPAGGGAPQAVAYYDAINTNGALYTAGDVLAEIAIFTIGSPSTVATYWVNITQSIVITAPTLTDLTYRNNLKQVTPADSLAAVLASAVASFTQVWNGTNWDRLPGTAALGAKTNSGGGTGACSAISASTTVATAIAANAATRKWIISNAAAVVCYVGVGFVPTSSLYTYMLAAQSGSTPGGSCEGNDQCDIKVILASSTGNVMATKVTA